MNTSKLLRGNAAFLLLMGGGAAIADAAGHFLGRGPFGQVMPRSPLAISSFEAHLLAVLIGALLWTGAGLRERRRLHVLAAAVHLVLGGSNLLYFESAFGALDLRGFGAVVTALHLAFALAEAGAAAWLRPPTDDVALAAQTR